MDSNTELAAAVALLEDGLKFPATMFYTRPLQFAEAMRTILTALTQPAEQIADGAVGEPPYLREAYMQAQAKAAASQVVIDGLRERLELTGDFAEGPDGIECRDDTIQLLDERVRRQKVEIDELRALAQQARAQALEEAAKVAEDHGEQYHEPTQSDYDRRDGAYAAAQAIRALNGQGGGV